ncbi:MAG: RuvX/YqgF family protein [Candidatus Peregrinibacteria bacterium]|nr:RuvX/YqgF family protein [Candidatus Peregrinibacteria bacterium]
MATPRITNQRLLGIDVGGRRSGIASFDPATDIVLPLPSINHASQEELIEALVALAHARGVTHIIVGLPLLPSGDEGAQARKVRECVDALTAQGFTVIAFDERYTTSTPKKGEVYDVDSASACQILQSYLGH